AVMAPEAFPPSKGSASKKDESLPGFKRITVNMIDFRAKAWLERYRPTDVDENTLKLPSNEKRATLKGNKVVPTINATSGEYIFRMRGCLYIERDFWNNPRLAPGALNDHTFRFKFLGQRFIMDTRRYGNLSGYVRRSDKPNAEIEVLNYQGIHVMIKAKEKIRKNVEVTLVFDEDYTSDFSRHEMMVRYNEKKKYDEADKKKKKEEN
ncbi:hypothetical protein PMAYCL1PPCAC_27823, partial [Pristionchus mayeri]